MSKEAAALIADRFGADRGEAEIVVGFVEGRAPHVERRQSIDRAREPDIGFAESAWRWASGQELAKVLRTSGTSAGDFVRATRQVIDLAGQLAQAVGPGDLRRTCRAVVDAMRRGVVAADMTED